MSVDPSSWKRQSPFTFQKTDTQSFHIIDSCLQLPFSFWISKFHTIRKNDGIIRLCGSYFVFENCNSIMKTIWKASRRKEKVWSSLLKKKQRNTFLIHSVKNQVFGSNYKKMLLNNHRYGFSNLFPVFKIIKTHNGQEDPKLTEK